MTTYTTNQPTAARPQRVARRVRQLAAVAIASMVPAAVQAQWSCTVAQKGVPLSGVPEASGIAASHRVDGLLWVHNDGEAALHAVSDGGKTRRIAVGAVPAGDWEAMASGPCPGGTCLYIGDIGDNDGNRKDVLIHRLNEPANGSDAAPRVETLRATYPDGPRDAEAMFVLGDGSLYVVTKGERGPVTMYRMPQFRTGGTARFEKVATISSGSGKGQVSRRERVTDGGVSPDGRWIALRTLEVVRFYDAKELTAGKVRPVFEFDVTSAAEAQGEGIAIEEGGVVWLASEGGGKQKPGTLSRLECRMP